MPELLQTVQLHLTLLNHLQRQLVQPLDEWYDAVLFLVVDKFSSSQPASLMFTFLRTVVNAPSHSLPGNWLGGSGRHSLLPASVTAGRLPGGLLTGGNPEGFQ